MRDGDGGRNGQRDRSEYSSGFTIYTEGVACFVVTTDSRTLTCFKFIWRACENTRFWSSSLSLSRGSLQYYQELSFLTSSRLVLLLLEQELLSFLFPASFTPDSSTTRSPQITQMFQNSSSHGWHRIQTGAQQLISHHRKVLYCWDHFALREFGRLEFTVWDFPQFWQSFPDWNSWPGNLFLDTM